MNDLEDVDGVDLTVLMPSTNVLVDVRRLLAPVIAVWTLEPRLLAAFVGQMPVQGVLLAVDTRTVRTGELLRSIVAVRIVYVGEWRSGP